MPRRKGVPNKITASVKEMILLTLTRAGGVDYLLRQAEAEPKAFLSLVGRILPLEVSGPNAQPFVIHFDEADARL